MPLCSLLQVKITPPVIQELWLICLITTMLGVISRSALPHQKGEEYHSLHRLFWLVPSAGGYFQTQNDLPTTTGSLTLCAQCAGQFSLVY